MRSIHGKLTRAIALACVSVSALLVMPTIAAAADRVSAVAGEVGGATEAPAGDWILWYRKPAKVWEEALPVGNGRMGAMVFGGVPQERVQFNEYTVWTGRPHGYQREGAVKFLPEIRRLLQEGRAAEREAIALSRGSAKADGGENTSEAKASAQGARELMKLARAKQKEAEELAMREFMGDPVRQKAFQPCGDLWLEFAGHERVSSYRRWLDLDAAVSVVEYEVGGTRFRREVFATHPDRTVMVRVSAEGPGKIDCRVRVSSPHKSSRVAVEGSNTLVLQGEVEPEGVRFESRVEAAAVGGQITAEDGALGVRGATQLTLRLVAASSFANFRQLTADPQARCREMLKSTAGKSWNEMRQGHTADHGALFRRVGLDLGGTAAAQLPTDERIAGFAQGNDPQLAALVFQYGRYLLVASSRAKGQPATLQGVWNDKLQPPWDSKWTCNINTQMNYWPVEVANLSPCAEPLFDAIDELVVSGTETARCPLRRAGWVLHHNFDLWRGTAPVNASDHGIWVTGGAWLSMHLWEHFLFTQDRDFLRRRAYPVMKGAALFFTDFLVEDPYTGRLVSGPSNSPEQGGLVMGPAMDHQIVRSLFGACVEAARLLDTDREFAAKLAAMRGRIAPDQVGQHGQLQEWLEDKDDPKNTHRHVSHLWAVHPGAEITWRDAPLLGAARQSLVYRGDAATGWSMGWKVNLWARFLDGDHAYTILTNLLRPVGSVKGQGGMYPNLFDAHPPFQIDGNFGAAAGIAEMLLQSHVREADGTPLVHLLPALPKAWSRGSVRGLRARGGLEVDLAWKEGRLTECTLHSTAGGRCRLRLGERTVDVTVPAGQSRRLDRELRGVKAH